MKSTVAKRLIFCRLPGIFYQYNLQCQRLNYSNLPMLPPRPTSKKYDSAKTEQNLSCLLIKQYKQYLPALSQKALTDIFSNIPRPPSSKPYRVSPHCSRISSCLKITPKQPSSIKQQNLSSEKEAQQRSFAGKNPPSVSSKYWAVYQIKSERLIYGLRSKKRIEVASLTKIMNLVAIFALAKEHSLNPKQIKIAMSELATTMIGTTASFKKRDVVSLEDLLYAMMLPSGNDAACQIALVGGTILKLAELGKVKRIYERQEVESLVECRSNIIRYLGLMNKLSIQFGMLNTSWANPHGLSNKQNKTTIQDMCRLCRNALQNTEIRKIVNTKLYSCKVETYFGNTAESRTMSWENTNRMLWRGWNGIKTGVTPNAGPCLAASCQHAAEGKDYQFLVVIANCANMSQRWEEVQLIVEWAIKNELQ